MAIDIFMVVTDQRGTQLAGESQQTVYDPYLKRAVTAPVELLSFSNRTENTFTFDGTGGSGAGKVVFDPFTVTKNIDALSQATFLAQAQGTPWKYVDIILTKATGQDPGTGGLKPFLAYRLGTVGISEINPASSDESPSETVSFVYGQLQIGYQAQKPDGTYLPFAPVGWDRVKNIKI